MTLTKNALLEDIENYKASKSESLYLSILERYYAPFKEKFEEQKRENQELLKDFPFCYAPEDLPEVLPIWQDDGNIIYAAADLENLENLEDLEKNKNNFYTINRLDPDRASLQNNISVAVEARLWIDDLKECERLTKPENMLLDMNIPLYLIFSAAEWNLLLQTADLKELIETNRVVFLVGSENIKKWFTEDGVIFPSKVVGMRGRPENVKLIQDLYIKKAELTDVHAKEIDEYYSTPGRIDEINKRFAEGKPRILFITTRFSTAIQYHERDCMLAAKNLGCETVFLIEPDGIHRVDRALELKTVAEFKPDAVLLIDHFRYEQPFFYPKEIIFVTWIQDTMPHIMDRTTPNRLHERDFLMNHFITWRQFFMIGYNRQKMVEAPVPANHHIYHPYELTDEEKNKYGTDICLVCHASDTEEFLNQIIGQFGEDEKPILTDMYHEYHRLAMYKGLFYYNREDFIVYVESFLYKKYNLQIDSEASFMIGEHMAKWFNQAVFRQVIVDWLLDAGFTNMKLWGRGWTQYEKYKKYAMGPAQNGETLSKIYQASKIVLGNNIITTAAARAWESMLSGAFYLSNSIPGSADGVDIRKIMTPGKDLVIFYDRKDLIKKVGYYLKNDEERREMARKGRETALKKMTYDALMDKVIKFIAKDVNSGR